MRFNEKMKSEFSFDWWYINFADIAEDRVTQCACILQPLSAMQQKLG